MPLIIGWIFTLLLIIIFVAFAIPMTAMFLATSLIRSSAKFTEGETTYLRIFNYLITGFVIGLGLGILEATGPVSFVFNLLLTVFVWPMGLFLEMTGSFKGDEGTSSVFYGGVFLGFVFTQIKAVRMILQRADDATNLDDE